jgi:energy-coupling factor transporter ATP-binding protein EcfA2
MFDEPTAGMSVDEVPVILELIQEIKQQKDKTILLVEHKMDVVRSLADRIIVLHQGAARRRRRAGRGDRLADRAGSVSRGAREWLTRCSRWPASTRTSATITSCRASIFAVPRGETDDAARAQRRRQDDDAAHDHGVVAGVGGRDPVRERSTSRSARPRDRRPRHRLRARIDGHLRRAHRAGKPALAARKGPLDARASTGSFRSSRP